MACLPPGDPAPGALLFQSVLLPPAALCLAALPCHWQCAFWMGLLLPLFCPSAAGAVSPQAVPCRRPGCEALCPAPSGLPAFVGG